MNDWKKCKLGDVAEITSSKRIFLADYVEGGVPFYRSKEIIERSAGKEISNPLFISNEKYQQIVNKFGAPQYGEMLLTSVGTLGIPYRVSQTDKFYFKDGNLTWFRKLKDISCDYLYYFFLSPIGKEKLETITIGSTQKALTIKALQNLDISLPSMEEQRRIAQILGALDDKIELLQKQNKTLEDMAKAIFKSWFVDFDVVHAKANLAKRRRSPTETLGDDTLSTKADIMREYHLTDELYDLFPSDFENSSLGPIPLGWQVKTVQDLGEVVCGKTPSTSHKEFYGGNIPFITIPDMHDSIFANKTERYLTNEGAQSQPTKTLPPFSVCVSCIATPGLVTMTTIHSQTNQQINSVIPRNLEAKFYNYYVLRSVADQIRAQGSGGSVFVNLNKTAFSKIKVLWADQTLQKLFTKESEIYFDKILNNLKQIQTLTELRDTLLPRLISGKIRV